ncbi:MAG TPA: long-chain fatty acid--CoA ligase [Gammaproteobacteria bacterium]|nr:long-chain fatty acid--CoA ligase [Gammaproteobacteria bacterium]
MAKKNTRASGDASNSTAITVEEAGTLGGLFRQRVKRTPDNVAHHYFDPDSGEWRQITWRKLAEYVARFQAAMEGEELKPGDRVGIMLSSSPEWVAVDQAALGLGLVTVPLYLDDNAGNTAYMLEHSGARLAFVRTGSDWTSLHAYMDRLGEVQRVVCVDTAAGCEDARVLSLDRWLPPSASKLRALDKDPNALATIIYTSGTTGRPKGVMLTHHNLLWNARATWDAVPTYPDDIGLSFLPMAHAYERTSGYYHSLVSGLQTAFNRSIDQLMEDFATIRPTTTNAVPRIFERIYGVIQDGLASKSGFARALFELTVDVGWSRFERQQGRDSWHPSHLLWPLLDAMVAKKIRALFGGRLRFTTAGGAALSPDVSRMFVGVGIPVLQGYGLTEASPVVSTNRLYDNDPSSVGPRLSGVQVKMQQNGELLVNSPGVMKGYWRDPEATRKAIDETGWLHTGDKVARLEHNRIYLTGRFKEIVVMASGEKTSPVDMEQAIMIDPIFEQVMVIGEARPFMAALVVLSERGAQHVKGLGFDPASDEQLRDERLEAALLERVAEQLKDFPHYAQVRRMAVLRETWTPQNGMLTPTMKLRRRRILEAHQDLIDYLYEGHAQVSATAASRNVRVAG